MASARPHPQALWTRGQDGIGFISTHGDVVTKNVKERLRLGQARMLAPSSANAHFVITPGGHVDARMTGPIGTTEFYRLLQQAHRDIAPHWTRRKVPQWVDANNESVVSSHHEFHSDRLDHGAHNARRSQGHNLNHGGWSEDLEAGTSERRDGRELRLSGLWTPVRRDGHDVGNGHSRSDVPGLRLRSRRPLGARYDHPALPCFNCGQQGGVGYYDDRQDTQCRNCGYVMPIGQDAPLVQTMDVEDFRSPDGLPNVADFGPRRQGAAFDPVGAILHEFPHWEPLEYGGRSEHRVWGWTDPDGVQHSAGCGAGTHNEKSLKEDAQRLRQRFRRCEAGACNCAQRSTPLAPGPQEPLQGPQEPAERPLAPGDRVQQGWVIEIDGPDALVTTDAGEEDILPVAELRRVATEEPNWEEVHENLFPGMRMLPWHERPQQGKGVDPTDLRPRQMPNHPEVGYGADLKVKRFWQTCPLCKDVDPEGCEECGEHGSLVSTPVPSPKAGDGAFSPHRMRPTDKWTPYDLGPRHQGAVPASYYHVAPQKARRQILMFGLKPGTFPDVYMWQNPESAQVYRDRMQDFEPHDIWHVDPAHVQVRHDSGDMLRTAPVAPPHLRLLGSRRSGVPTGHGDLYHVSPRSNRESIQEYGLLGHEQGTTSSPWTQDLGQPPGNYMFDNVEDARDYAYTLQGQKSAPYPGDDEEMQWEDRYEHPPEPEDWDEEANGYWDETEEAEPRERTEDPNGYDIHRIDARGLPIMQDPEPKLHQRDNRSDLGTIQDYHEETRRDDPAATSEDLDRELGNYYGESPMRYIAPGAVHPSRIQLHEHVPSWDMTQDGFYERIEDPDHQDRQVPDPWHQIPFTEIPFPGHESRFPATGIKPTNLPGPSLVDTHHEVGICPGCGWQGRPVYGVCPQCEHEYTPASSAWEHEAAASRWASVPPNEGAHLEEVLPPHALELLHYLKGVTQGDAKVPEAAHSQPRQRGGADPSYADDNPSSPDPLPGAAD